MSKNKLDYLPPPPPQASLDKFRLLGYLHDVGRGETKTYFAQCLGNDIAGNEVLSEAIDVKVEMFRDPESGILSTIVECPYNKRDNGRVCNASDLNRKSATKEARCHFNYDEYACAKE